MGKAELAARAAVACWAGSEGRNAAAIRGAELLTVEMLRKFLNAWMLARGNPLSKRDELLSFLNRRVMPALREVDDVSEEAYLVVEKLSKLSVAEEATRGRPTSMLSKLAHAVSPMVFVPYDHRVRKALRIIDKGIRAHHYRDYMAAVLSEKPAFVRELQRRRLSAESLKATDMSQSLFEMRALDKWLMLCGGFNAARMERDVKNRWSFAVDE
jgi:hypothetical protein